MNYADLKAIVFDVDGVLTDGKIIFDHQGNEQKEFYVRDGQLIRFLRNEGFVFGAITGRDTYAVEKRMKDLRVDFVRQGCEDKKIAYTEFKNQYGLTDAQIAYIGDDVVDIGVLKQVGLAIAPADAVEYIKPFCHYITEAPGGRGVLREVIDLIIAHTQRTEKLMQFYS